MLTEQMDSESPCQELLDSVFNLYMKFQNYHWNVQGQSFAEYHEFFGDLYEFAYNNVDKIAEQIRTLGYKANLFDVGTESINSELNSIGMMLDIVQDMKRTREIATMAAEYAESELQNRGLVNYIEGFIDEMSKHIWMAESYTK